MKALILLSLVSVHTLAAVCPFTNGSEANTVACTCGSMECTSTTGLICYSELGGGSCRKTDVGAFGYLRVESGTCGSMTNRKPIVHKADCEAAATSMGLDDEAIEMSANAYPPGCFWSAVYNRLYYNIRRYTPHECSHSDTQASTDFCLCLAASDCTRTNGLLKNTATCSCGATVCTATTGLFCTKSTNTCRQIPICTVTDGSAANNASCACGTNVCTDSNGLVCNSPTDTCSHPPCTVTDGSAANNAICASGSGCTIIGNCFESLNFPNDYGSDESCSVTVQRVLAGETLYSVAFNTESWWDKLIVGSTTYSGTSGPSNVTVSVNDVITWSSDNMKERSGFQVCLVAACLQTDGSAANSDACVCGTAVCTAVDGLVCNSPTHTCSHPLCTVRDGSAANSDACVCGTAVCTAVDGLVCNSPTHTCRQIPICTVTDGSAANPATCACGTTDCTADTGLFCNAEEEECGVDCASSPAGTKVSCFVTTSVVDCRGALDMCVNNTAAVKTWYNDKNNC